MRWKGGFECGTEELSYCVRYCYCKAKVCSSSVSLVYVVRLRIIFSKAALQKRGSMEPIEPPLDPPLKGGVERGRSELSVGGVS